MSQGNSEDFGRKRQEAELFRRSYQPVSLFFGAVGLILLAWVYLTVQEGQPMPRDLAGGGLVLVSFPILILLIRLCRGHLRHHSHE